MYSRGKNMNEIQFIKYNIEHWFGNRIETVKYLLNQAKEIETNSNTWIVTRKMRTIPFLTIWKLKLVSLCNYQLPIKTPTHHG